MSSLAGKSEQAELHIQSRRIVKIVEQAIWRLRLISKLPSFIRNDPDNALRAYFKPAREQFILNTLNRYSPVVSSSSDPGHTADSHMYYEITGPIDHISEHRLHRGRSFDVADPHICELVNMVFNCRGLVDALTAYNVPDQHPSVSEFLELLDTLKNVLDERLSISGVEEAEREEELREAYRLNQFLSKSIDELQVEVERQQDVLETQEEEKRQMVEDMRAKMENLKQSYSQKLNSIVLQSEKQMMITSTNSETHQQELAEAAESAKRHRDEMLERNLAEEKKERVKMLKVQTQLSSWLAKFDNDIGERQAELEELQAAFDEESRQYRELQQQLDEQQPTYDALMREKAAEDERIFQEALYRFILNRSARCIQRAWRAYWQRKLARKARRKGRKSKK